MQKIILNDMKWQRLRTQGCFIIKKLLKKIKYVFYKKVKSFVKKRKLVIKSEKLILFFSLSFLSLTIIFLRTAEVGGGHFLFFLETLSN